MSTGSTGSNSNRVDPNAATPQKQNGASSLMGMFDPPPPSPLKAGSAVGDTTTTTSTSSPATQHALSPATPSAAPAVVASPQTKQQESPQPSTRSSIEKPSSPSALLSMFDPPPSSPTKIPPVPRCSGSINSSDRQTTVRMANISTALLGESNITNSSMDDDTPRQKKNLNRLNDLFSDNSSNNNSNNNYNSTYDSVIGQPPLSSQQPPPPLQLPPMTAVGTEYTGELRPLLLPPEADIHYVPVKQPLTERHYNGNNNNGHCKDNTLSNTTSWTAWRQEHCQPSTIAGAGMFLLYHVVFCLANGSAIVRPHSSQPILGEMAKLTTVGILFAGPFYISRLGQDVPAVFPSVDLFLAPFLASAAASVDKTLAEDGIDGSESNDIFLASFAVLASIGMFAAGSLLLLAAKFKLANLGTFLPYSVLCGFFSAVGVLLWALSFSVDTNGKTWQSVFFSGDIDLIGECVLHHLPSLIVGILMNILGPKHPFYVILLIILTLVGFYTTMWATGTSLEEAQEQQWFWSREELSIAPSTSDVEGLFAAWAPPVPFGHISAMLQGKVHWRAVQNGLTDMFTLAFLYLLRSSIHASAMKKNINNLVCKKRTKKEKSNPDTTTNTNTDHTASPNNNSQTLEEESSHTKRAIEAISDNVRLVNESLSGTGTVSGARQSIRPIKSPKSKTGPQSKLALTDNNSTMVTSPAYEYTEVRPKPCRRTLKDIFVEYGYALMLVSFSGGFGVCPTVATSNTMYAIGAGGPAPQYGSVLLLIIFYATDFHLVRYIPKACFSSLLVLGAVDTFMVWFALSYKKTQDLMEWLVVPVIVAFSLIVGFLNAVFLGIGISTFVFVAAFFRVGVVKFNATGMEIRSTIERSITISDWLDGHGDYIQVLVLQNYLFFGNASSILQYIATMFEDVEISDATHSSHELPPFPKVLIMDMSLITGMDTSTLDIFAEIKELCKNNDCKLFLCGLSNRAKKGLALTGVKAGTGPRDQRAVRFFPDLDVALGRAEDLISLALQEKETRDHLLRVNSADYSSRSGFHTALKLIDEQHGEEFAKSLLEFEAHTQAIELRAGDKLFACDGGIIQDGDRGLFFIESGMLKIERDAGNTLTRGKSTSTLTSGNRSLGTLNNLHARSGTLGRQRAATKASSRGAMTRTFRLARIGPGWVCGAIEGASGLKHDGVHIAVTDCRLHHLSFQKLEQMESEHPLLILALYKMLSQLMARRQEITIEQLATFHSIMSSPAHSKPVSRAAMMALRR